ncbi:metal-dependent hydrolase [Pediococcus claussenii]|uniref:UPF0173 metal-dependent hydrolase PECL_31 n=1 Tax=Pediococcus claussenii (strain ATCC BAA-344 / DSM 14800 / JCM 18046 / KCTC 3811 / LMG 21948 / P06) TaxID=701521 RepID=G8PEA8_PEDCP|nr:metal-dependent hydrolase [Pediococcus claussenii]AEV94369.1 metallo-beta-lactamase superfamily protein [Pediococcus claussenii ATCC BAA-344]ANZ69590.1 metal-dependent hydrolase [Pediococcus claussenii]ANZ71407.1 metal-dependent hydrolase [Pediococcus claussenii]KRN19370.1 hypothetical protein IV79_GL001420 [Pediococcus claussenii]
MKIIYHGHSCVEVTLDNKMVLIFDPFITGNPQTDIDLNHHVDYIFVSHGHAHHVGDMVALSKKFNAPIIAIEELAHFAEVQGATTHPMNLGGSSTLPFGFVKVMHAQHSSSIEINGQPQYAGDACGFLVKADNKTIYFAGDTSNFGDMELFGKAFNIDVALLPIGGRYTMGPSEAAICARRLQASKVIPIHYNTYPEIQQDPKKFATLLPEGTVQILNSGEYFDVQ